VGELIRPLDRWIKEAIHIRKEQDKSMNRDEGSYQLSYIYRQPAIRQTVPEKTSVEVETSTLIEIKVVFYEFHYLIQHRMHIAQWVGMFNSTMDYVTCHTHDINSFIF